MNKVIFWFNTFISEGESNSAAYKHAFQRAFESGDINEKQIDALESALDWDLNLNNANYPRVKELLGLPCPKD